jgi:excisionase family DNA binding protein
MIDENKPLEKLLTIDELARHLNVKKKSIYNWVSQKSIPYYKLGSRLLRFKLSEIEVWKRPSKLQVSDTRYVSHVRKKLKEDMQQKLVKLTW